jgi:hypothetical protein
MRNIKARGLCSPCYTAVIKAEHLKKVKSEDDAKNHRSSGRIGSNA